MSSVPEETGDGHTDDDTQSSEEYEGRANVSELAFNQHRTKPSTSTREADNDSNEVEEEEATSTLDGHTLSDHVSRLADANISDGDRAPTPTSEIGRPSSADGSLSIPDDTPSVQVRWYADQ